MRLIGRHDTSLAAALIVGVFILFHQPLKAILDVASDIERQYHVDLIQSLVVLGVVFTFHQYRKRQEARAALVVAAAEAEQARVRSRDLERLVGLSRSLAMATDYTRLSQALVRYLPKFTQERASWVLICQGGYWDVLVRDGDDRYRPDRLEAVADRALAAAGAGANASDDLRLDGLLCFPMVVGGDPLGIILVEEEPALAAQDCRSIEAAAALVAISVRNVQMLIETRENSLRDGLTGCFTRAHAIETLRGELRRARRGRTPLSLVMFDVDHFKQVNDTHGHLAGDHLLAEVGRALGAVLRTSDVKCRYGGDEFLIILPETPAIGARQVAESIRQAISQIAIRAGDGEVTVTLSVGVATADSDERDPQAFIARADRALYRAKQAGRDRVHPADAAPATSLRLVGAAV